jgi:hypothetical protein
VDRRWTGGGQKKDVMGDMMIALICHIGIIQDFALKRLGGADGALSPGLIIVGIFGTQDTEAHMFHGEVIHAL